MLTLREILARFRDLSALVVGDICLDHWCRYDPAACEPSRETGLHRIAVVEHQVTPGAGGTVANNLAALEAGRVAVLGLIGDDGAGFELRRALAARGIEDLCVTSRIQTFTYTKVINASNGVEDQPRLDFINPRPLSKEDEQLVIAQLRQNWPAFDVILIADQAETGQTGVVSPALREVIAELASASPEKVVWADSRMRVEHFRGITVKPNQQEAEAACHRLFGRVDFPALRRHLSAPLLLVTHGKQGVLLVEENGQTWVPTHPVENPVDICGAGDSFSAGAALALSVTRCPRTAATIGNAVASVTIMKPGTGTGTPEEVLAIWPPSCT